MDSIANHSYLAFEFLNFQDDTNLIAKVRNHQGHSVSKTNAHQFVTLYLAQRFNTIPSVPKELNAVYKNNILRKCFNKCKKFVLEDWVDYSEIDCTLNCASEVINASKVLDTIY